MMVRRLESSQTGKLGIVLAGVAVIFYVLLQLSSSIAAGSPRFAIMVLAAFAALFLAARIARDWRSGVMLFFAWLLFEDLVRKYLGNSMYVYFGKDVLVGITYVGFWVARMRGEESGRFRVPFRVPLALFVVLGVAQAFNSGSPSFWYSLLGLKLYFYYLPLMFLGYALLRSERDLIRFLVISVGMAAPIALVGILQAIVGMDFLNPHSGLDIEELAHGVRTTSAGLLVARPDSVFVSDGRFQGYLMLAFILALGTTGLLLLRSRRGRILVLPAVGLILLAAMLCGGRTAFVFVGASAVVLPLGMLWGAPPNLGERHRLVRAMRRGFLFVVVAVALAVMIFSGVFSAHWAYYEETILPGSEYSQTANRAWYYPAAELLKGFSDRDLIIGHGIGTASLGTQYVARIMNAPPSDLGVESGYGNLALELGVLGPILWLVLTVSLLVAGGKVLLKLRGTWAFPVGLSVLWFSFVLLFPLTWESLSSYENFILNAYLWILIGFLFKLPVLAARSRGGELAVSSPGEEPKN